MDKAAVFALLVMMTSAHADPTPATKMCRSAQATDTTVQILREQVMGIADRVSEQVFRANSAIRDVAAVDYNAVQSVAVCQANLYVKASGDLDHGTDVALQRMSATKPDLILLARTKRVGNGPDAMFRVAINYSVQKSGGQTFVRVATPYGAEATFDMTVAMGYLLGVDAQASAASRSEKPTP